MKNRWVLLACSILLASGASSHAAEAKQDYATWHKGHEKVSPVWTLPRATAPTNMVWDVPTMPGQLDAAQFSAPEVCGGCHQEILAQWKGSMMANAWRDPVFLAVYKSYLAQSKTDAEREETAMCSRCHTPVGYGANEQARYLTGEVSAVAAQGISCDVCHSVARSAGVGNGAFILAPGTPGTKYGPRTDAASPFHETAYSELHTRSEFCGMCHDVAHAHNIMPIENTYTEWRTGPYNTGDPKTSTHCQDCHMRQTPEVAATGMTALPDSPGAAAPEAMGAKPRSHLWQHWFIGGNATVPELLGSPQWAKMARDRLAKAAVVSIAPPPAPLRAGQAVRVDVRVDNVGAGHYLPTGLTYVRQMWIHLTVQGTDGTVLYESGAVDTDGTVDPDAVMYKTVLGEGGTERKPTFFLPAAVQVLSDKRIRPRGYSVETYTILLPAAAKGEIAITATLRYRSAPQSLVKALLGKDAPTLPIFDMASAARKIQVQ